MAAVSPESFGQGRGLFKDFGGIQGQGVGCDRRCKAIVGGRILLGVAENWKIVRKPPTRKLAV
jgi:hypothetical protein